MKRILITAPLRQEPKIFREYQEGLDRLIIPEGFKVDRFYVVNNCDEVIPEIRNADWLRHNTGGEYTKTHNDHLWTRQLVTNMSELRNMTIHYAIDGGYDYWFSVDTDLVLDPHTLEILLDADRDIISEVFWTKSPGGNWWCNGWMYDQCDADGNYTRWMEKPGIYRVGMTGACMLVKSQVLEAGVDYTQIPCIKNALMGEDRHFCIRAACAGFDLWMDTSAPAQHLYTEQVYQQYMEQKREAANDVEAE